MQSIYAIINAQFPKNRLEFLNRPLFKHPPLYPFALAVSYLLLGSHVFAAIVPSLLAWAGICLMTRNITHNLFGPIPSFLAFLLCLIDPMGWALSIKIGTDVFVTFLVLVALWLFLKNFEHGSLWNCGIFLGLASLTKYSALTYVMAMVLVLGVHRRYAPLIVLITPLCLMLAPWIGMQFAVYGSSCWRISYEDFFIPQMFLVQAILLTALCYLFAQPLLTYWSKTSFWDRPWGIRVARWIPTGLMALPIAWLGTSMNSIFLWDSVPWTTFLGNPSTFPGYYFRQPLICLPFLLVVPFSSLLLLRKVNRSKLFTLITLVFLYFIFAILWSNHQIRYLYAIVPVLIILASGSWHKVWEITLHLTPWPGRICRIFLVLIGIFFLAKTFRNDWFFAFVNQAGRF